MDHAFEVSANPRLAGSCARCGRLRTWHRDDPPRNPERERLIQRDLAAAANTDVEDLIEFAHDRANPGPVINFLDRDYGVDSIEEAADHLNYLTWWLLAVAEREGDWADLEQAIKQAIVALYGSWQATQHARHVEMMARRLSTHLAAVGKDPSIGYPAKVTQ